MPRQVSIILFLIFIVGSLRFTNAQSSYQVYLPILNQAARPSPFGFESHPPLLGQPEISAQAQRLGATRVRLHGAHWNAVQPQENGPMRWEALATLDRGIAAAQELGLTPTVIIHGAPLWATVVPATCAAIREDRLDAFAVFLEELARRYRDRVQYWELGNEPDVDPRLVASDAPFGCMGNIDDPYYGGERYGRLLQVAAPALRRGNPQAKIIFGGVLLSTPNTLLPEYGKPERFVEGALRAGAAPYFDILAFHAYPNYTNQPLVDHDTGPFSPWWELGGWTFGKVRYLREVMERYEVRKPLWLNEMALLCNPARPYCNPPDAGFFNAKAQHLVRSFARATSVGVEALFWYTLEGPGWRYASLLDVNQQPRPAYLAFQHMARTVLPFMDVRRVDREYGLFVEAYRFVKGPTVVDVLWSPNTELQIVSVPQDLFIRATRFDGSPLTGQATGNRVQLEVGFEAVYIERYP